MILRINDFKAYSYLPFAISHLPLAINFTTLQISDFTTLCVGYLPFAISHEPSAISHSLRDFTNQRLYSYLSRPPRASERTGIG
ncbi:hypothetical protein [Sphingobacterium allocomposti]|uniref:hypothetical protein n=1 Tax=Sphingobacterium allocomposti TaxID=415956 RepID=UPI0011E83CAF|nr:hypothetical protein [Sphingobacterium composti Yoo et al. 2007 non Ten et al. 2007]